VNVFDGLLHRHNCLWGRAEWIFVGGHLDDALRGQSEVSGHIFDGLSGFVGDEVFELQVGVVPDGHRACWRGAHIACNTLSGKFETVFSKFVVWLE